MTLELITISELLRDPQYRKYFSQVPKLPPHYTPATKPWKLIVQKKGETIWRSKRYGTYAEAFAGLKTMLPKIDNAAINCPGLGFMPPVRTVKLKGKTDAKGKPILRSLVWKPALDGDTQPHTWCPHCRRPSIFRMAVAKRSGSTTYRMPAGEPKLRCVICGASEDVVDLRDPTNTQKWDTNRPKLVIAK